MSRIETIMESVEDKYEDIVSNENLETEYSDHTEYTDYSDCVLIS